MKLLTRDTDYAVRAICCMAAKPEKIFTVTELTKELRMPRPFLRKILQRLNQVGLVRSAKGLGGGFRLVVDPSRITLVDLIESFQGPLSINECIFKKKVCPNRGKCALRSKICEIEDYVVNKLRSTTVAALLNEGA